MLFEPKKESVSLALQRKLSLPKDIADVFCKSLNDEELEILAKAANEKVAADQAIQRFLDARANRLNEEREKAAANKSSSTPTPTPTETPTPPTPETPAEDKPPT